MTNHIESITAGLAESMPEPTPSAVEAERADAEAVPASGREYFQDKTGAYFDEALHVWDAANERPKFNKDGNFRRRRTRDNSPQSSTLNTGTNGVKSQAVTARQTAASICGIIYTIGYTIGGEEWEPTPEENKGMLESWTRYCEVKNITDLPPGVVVLATTGMYILPRMFRPKTKTKLTKIKEFVKYSLLAKFFKRKAETVVNGSRSDFRDDNERKK